MKKTILIILVLVFSVSFNVAQPQSIRGAIETVDQNFDKAVDSAKKNIGQGRFDQAIADYETAKKLKPGDAGWINVEIGKINAEKQKAQQDQAIALEKRRQREKDEAFDAAIASSERNTANGQYEDAKRDILTALELKPEKEPLYTDKIAQLNDLILKADLARIAGMNDQLYNEAIADAEANIAQRRWADAINCYNTARGLKPGNADIIDRKIAELEAPAQLSFYRKGSILTILEDNYDILLDDVIVTRTKNRNWKTIITVNDITTKTVWAIIEGRNAEVHIDFEPGKVYYVRCGVSSREVKTGEWGTRKLKNGTTERYEKTKMEYTPTLQLIDINQGKREYDAIKSK